MIAGSYVVRNDPAIAVGTSAIPQDPEQWPITYPRSAMQYAQAQGKPFLVMSLSSPYDLANFPEANAAMASTTTRASPRRTSPRASGPPSAK